MFPTQRSSKFEELNENKGKNGKNLIYGDNLLNGGAGFYSNIDNEETKSWISPRSFKNISSQNICFQYSQWLSLV